MGVSHAFQQVASVVQEADLRMLERTVVVDFGGRLSDFRNSALRYRDLSPSNDSAEAARAVFETLRWAERIPDATRIVFPELAGVGDEADALTLAVKDRLTRAASGIVIHE